MRVTKSAEAGIGTVRTQDRVTPQEETTEANQVFDGLQRLHLMMGLQCNVRCTMCYQTDFSPKFNMPPAIYKERLMEVYPYINWVKLQGGEPTIMRNCRDAAEVLRNFPQIKLGIVTNGVHIDDFWHETFLRQAGTVSVSINAATAATYDRIVILGKFSNVVRNIERVLRDRCNRVPAVRISMVILKENVHEMVTLLKLAQSIGVDGVDYVVDPVLTFAGLPGYDSVVRELHLCHDMCQETRIDVTGLTDFRSKFLFRYPHHDSEATVERRCSKPMCVAPFRNVVIDWNGDVRVCCNSWVDLGNLYESPLHAIWRGSKATAFRRKMEKGSYLWCSPNCDDNANPSRLSLLHKYYYLLREDPRQLFRKVDQKARQLTGSWVTVKPPKKVSAPEGNAPPLVGTIKGSDRRLYLPVLNHGTVAQSKAPAPLQCGVAAVDPSSESAK